MLKRIVSFFRSSRDSSRAARVKLEQRRQVCALALAEAECRGDCRAIGFWTMQLRQATNDALRAS